MNQKKRTLVIQEFQSSAADSPVIMLLSLKAGGVGLNLTAASHVFLMDPVSTLPGGNRYLTTACFMNQVVHARYTVCMRLHIKTGGQRLRYTQKNNDVHNGNI